MPEQVWQAPNGELKEKERGSISSISRGCSFGQARFSEKARSFGPSRPSGTRPGSDGVPSS